jgi:hypothetical protein
VNNGTDPVEFGGLELFAADIAYLMFEPGHVNCFAKNTYTTFKTPFADPIIANSCN